MFPMVLTMDSQGNRLEGISRDHLIQPFVQSNVIGFDCSRPCASESCILPVMQISHSLWVPAPISNYCCKRCFPSISLEFLRIVCLLIVFCPITMQFQLEAGSIFSGFSNHIAVDSYKVSWKPHSLQGESAKLP